jgi:hypothetical protein
MLNMTGFQRPMTETLCMAFYLVLCRTGQDFPAYNVCVDFIFIN